MRAVVTGASSGIGRAIALAFAREGADIGVTYRGSAGAAAAVADEIRALGRAAAVWQADIGRDEEVERLVDDAFARFGRVDVWVNNAGADILTGSGAALSDIDKLDLLLRVDLRGTVATSWRVAERMRSQGGGVLLNMSWDHVLTGMPGRNPEMFSAVKGGVLSFSKSLARSMAPEVRVNVLAPGWIATAFADQLDSDRTREVIAATPLNRWGTPEDVAGAAVFLASREASFLTGAMLPVGGGIVM
jgi:3-oxoacyl-[acyl-carrier protein] reductase